MKRPSKERELNNAGLTLVELLIAMVILAIIVTPILKNFVSSARINTKSRHTMNATGLCETLMEEFESRKVSEMVDVLVNDYGYNAPVYDETYDNIYSVKGVETLLSGTKYDVKITLNGHDTYEALNQQTVYDIQNFAGGTNAIYSDMETMELHAAQYFADNSLETAEEHLAWMHKEVEIEIEKDSISLVIGETESVTLPVYEVRSRCYYVCENASVLDEPEKNIYPTDGSEMLIFSNEEALRKLAAEVKAGTRKKEELISRLDNILICMNPSTYANDTAWPGDCITIDNKDNVDTNIVIVKQNVGYLSHGGSGEVRLSYELAEMHDDWGPGLADEAQAHAKLRSDYVWDYTNRQVTFRNGRYGNSATGADAYVMLQGDSLAPAVELNRLYDIKIDIFNYETKEPVLTMTGTVTD